MTFTGVGLFELNINERGIKTPKNILAHLDKNPILYDICDPTSLINKMLHTLSNRSGYSYDVIEECFLLNQNNFRSGELKHAINTVTFTKFGIEKEYMISEDIIKELYNICKEYFIRKHEAFHLKYYNPETVKKSRKCKMGQYCKSTKFRFMEKYYHCGHCGEMYCSKCSNNYGTTKSQVLKYNLCNNCQARSKSNTYKNIYCDTFKQGFSEDCLISKSTINHL